MTDDQAFTGYDSAPPASRASWRIAVAILSIAFGLQSAGGELYGMLQEVRFLLEIGITTYLVSRAAQICVSLLLMTAGLALVFKSRSALCLHLAYAVLGPLIFLLRAGIVPGFLDWMEDYVPPAEFICSFPVYAIFCLYWFCTKRVRADIEQWRKPDLAE